MRVYTFDRKTLPATPLDQKTFSEYQKQPWKVARSLGRLFVAVEELHEDATIYVGTLPTGSHDFTWWTHPHALTDGLGVFDLMIQKKIIHWGGPANDPNKKKFTYRKPSWIEIFRRVKKRKPAEASAPVSQSRLAISPPYCGAVLFDENQTRVLREKAKSENASFNSYLLKKISTRFEASPQLWMFSVSAREFCDPTESIQSSYFLLNLKSNDSAHDIGQKIKAAFTDREPIENYYLGKYLSRLPRFAIKKITEIDFQKNTKQMIGLYSHLGDYSLPGIEYLIWYSGIRKTRPFSILSFVTNGKLSLSVLARANCFETNEIFQAWLKQLGESVLHDLS